MFKSIQWILLLWLGLASWALSAPLPLPMLEPGLEFELERRSINEVESFDALLPVPIVVATAIAVEEPSTATDVAVVDDDADPSEDLNQTRSEPGDFTIVNR
ncbi:hypothetical protein D9757_009078 [Collybiopsis confluens]|uniref:Secreted protein n=1 Tax=Collybiopsis confluens TaxID=2823264 RepID=A0A8H5HDR0_9AGAR|nr:hypothetical protein D9757_009078 [Collybiopsis confluens]